MSFAGTVTAESVVAASSFTAPTASFQAITVAESIQAETAQFSDFVSGGSVEIDGNGGLGCVTLNATNAFANNVTATGTVSGATGSFTNLTFNGQPVQVDVSGYLFI